jgi:hypothetical protein
MHFSCFIIEFRLVRTAGFPGRNYMTDNTNMLVFMLVLAGVAGALAAASLAHPARRAEFGMMVRKAVGCRLHDNPRQHDEQDETDCI